LRARRFALKCGPVKDPYQALGVDRRATAADIKKAFRRLTQQFHPDKNPGDKKAEERFKDVSQAYEILGDEDKRARWDEFGEMSLTQGFDPERARAYRQAQRGGVPGGAGGFSFEDLGQARGTSFDDLLSRLFGGGRVTDLGDILGGRGGRGPTAVAGQDIHGDIEVSFFDALTGVTVPLRIESRDGSSRVLDVKVPAGAVDGSRLRLGGQGGPGTPPGDVFLTVRVRPDKHLSRDGRNLILSLPVTALEAYRGGSIDVPTPWGTIALKLPPGSQNGQTLRVRGKGVQGPGKPAGDLLVTLDVRMPEAGDEELVRVLERLQGRTQVRAGLPI
jgi:curved DNA-binding protein